MLRQIEIIGEEQSEMLKRRIGESLASLNQQLQSKLNELCKARRHDLTEIFEKHQLQAQQSHEDQTEVVIEQIQNKMIKLFNEHMQQSVRVLRKEMQSFNAQLEEVIKMQRAHNKYMLTSFVNSHIEIKYFLVVIIVILLILLSLFIHTSFQVRK